MKIEKVAKAWDWAKADLSYWKDVAPEAHYLAARWKETNKRRFLDFGAGLGRHSLFFQTLGFDVKAFDLSKEAVEELRRKGVSAIESDMHHVGYPDASFDCLLAYHVCSHTDEKGIRLVAKEIERLLDKDGEFYLDLCDKSGWMFTKSGYPKLDASTVISQEEGPEFGVPHFCASEEDIADIFKSFEIVSLEERISYDASFQENGRHFWILGRKK